MQNPESADFTLMFIPVHVPKLVVMTAMSVAGFLAGVLLTVRKNYKHATSSPNPQEGHGLNSASTLSDEDRDYISEP
ncbi:hypothetical protein GCM10027037_03730 [Mucilaginibacter koreensis]